MPTLENYSEVAQDARELRAKHPRFDEEIPFEASLGDIWDATAGPVFQGFLGASEANLVRDVAKHGFDVPASGFWGGVGNLMRRAPHLAAMGFGLDRMLNNSGYVKNATDAAFAMQSQGDSGASWLPGMKRGENLHETMKNFAESYYGRGGWRNQASDTYDAALGAVSGAGYGLTAGASDYAFQHLRENPEQIGIENDPLRLKRTYEVYKNSDVIDQIMSILPELGPTFGPAVPTDFPEF